MSNVTRTINLELDFRQSISDLTRQIIDSETGRQLRIFRADSARFSLVFKDGENDFSMDDVAKISLEVKPRDATNPPTATMPLWMYGETETIPADGAPAIIDFAAEETALPDGAAWMTVTLYSATGEVMTTASGNITVLGNGRGEFADVPDVEDARDKAIAAKNEAIAARDRSEAAAIIAVDEANRAESIANNLQAVAEALSYRGTWSSGVAPSGAQRGYFWVIATAATWGGIVWQVGDAALYNGSTWSRVALDWLLAQANANIDALSQLVDRTKRPFGGVRTEGSTAQTARFWVPGYTVYLAGGDTEVGFFIEDEQPGGGRYTGCGFGGGWMITTHPTTRVIAFTIFRAGSHLNYANAIWPRPVGSVFTERTHIAATIKNVTTAPELELFINGVSQGVQTPATDGVYGESVRDLAVGADMPSGVNVNNGEYSCVQVFNRHLTNAERMAIVSSGGHIVPVSARAALELNLPCDDGAGAQLRDLSGKGRPGLLGLSGCDHLIVRDRGKITQGATNYASGTYLLGDRPILPENAYVTGLIINGEVMPLTAYFQTPTLRQIRIINGGGGAAWLQRSNGTTHETLVETPHGLTGLSIALTWEVV